MSDRVKSMVLITDGGPGQARSTLAAVRALGAAGHAAAVTTSGPNSLAAASRFCSKVIAVPPAGDRTYAAAVLEEFHGGGYELLLAGSDAALAALDIPGRDLADKKVMTERAESAGIATPTTFVFDSVQHLRSHAHDLAYPVVVKPAIKVTAGARELSARRIATHDDLLQSRFSTGPLVVQPYISQPLRAICGVAWQGDIVASMTQLYLRTWPPDCGGSCAAVSIPADENLEARLGIMLGDYDGIFQAQFAGDLLLDLNPRIYGSLPLAIGAGVNLPAILLDLKRGARPTRARGRSGMYYRWPEGDIRHLALLLRRRGEKGLRRLPEFRPRRRTAHSVWSVTDPAPVFARLKHAFGFRG